METPRYQETRLPGNLTSWADYGKAGLPGCKYRKYITLDNARSSFDIHQERRGAPCEIMYCGVCAAWHIVGTDEITNAATP